MRNILIHVLHIVTMRKNMMNNKKKRQICFRLAESTVKEMEQIRDKTGVPVSTQIELKLRGYEIRKASS